MEYLNSIVVRGRFAVLNKPLQVQSFEYCSYIVSFLVTGIRPIAYISNSETPLMNKAENLETILR